jgi:hypothetical protein
MHFSVAFAATAIFYWLSRRIPAMVEWAVPSGLLFGVVWLLVMYRGVIPLMAALRPLYLSNVVKRPLPALWPLPLLVHMTCVGLPIALAVRHFGPRPSGTPGGPVKRDDGVRPEILISTLASSGSEVSPRFPSFQTTARSLHS